LLSKQRVIVEDDTKSAVFAGSPALQALLAARVRSVQSTPLFDRLGRFLGVFSTHHRTPHRFGEAELRWLDLLARHASEVIERQAAAEQLARTQQVLEERVVQRTRWLSLMHEISRVISDAPSWDEALRRVLEHVCEAEHWQVGYVYIESTEHPQEIGPAISRFGDERFSAFHQLTMQQRYGRGVSLPGRVYAEGVAHWVNDAEGLVELLPRRAQAAREAGVRAGAALPIAVGGKVIAVLELFSDQAHPATEQLASLMRNVSGPDRTGA
jgi:GAF domain-containing protein